MADETSVDLTDLIPNLKARLSPPGSDNYPNATSSQWTFQLLDAFWEAYLDGLIGPYTIDDDGIVTPTGSNTTPISRAQQQIILFYVEIHLLTTNLQNLKTTFRAKAGPVEYETQQAATVLKALLDDASKRREELITNLRENPFITTVVIDNVIARTYAIAEGVSWFVGGSTYAPGDYGQYTGQYWDRAGTGF